MKLLLILFLFCFILGCETIEEIKEANPEHYKNYDPCDDLRRQIASTPSYKLIRL